MKHQHQKTLCFLIALLTAGSSLIACKDSADLPEESQVAGNASTETTSTTETGIASNLSQMPDADYQEYVFHILLNSEDDRYVDIMTEGRETGDTMNDLVYRRNLAVEEKYNITISGESMEPGDVTDTLEKCVQSDDTSYDLYFIKGSGNGLAMEGFLYELNALPHVDLTNPWWDQTAVEGLSIGEKVYTATGDITPSSLLTSACLVFNKNLFNNYDIAYPYDLAIEGTWTIDRMIEMIKGLTTDVNADGDYDYRTDLFSLSSWYSDSAFSLFYGCGATLSQKNEENIPVISYNMDKITTIYDKLYTLILDSNSYFVTDRDLYETTYACFNMGNAFFCDITLQKIGLFLRDMQDEYGIVPMPKLDETQENYISHVNGAAGFIVVPNNPADADRTGMIVEALAASAYDMITPSLYEVIVKTKNVSDMESAEMVNLVIRNRVFDPYYMYSLKGSDFVKDLLDKKSKNVSSTLEKYRSKAEKDLQKIIDAYAALES